MKKMMMVAACVGGLACMLACNKEEVGAYTPLPKIHLGERRSNINVSRRITSGSNMIPLVRLRS